MIKVHKKFIVLIVVFVLLATATFSVWYFLFNKEKTIEQTEVVKQKILTEEEKIMILNKLAESGTTTMTEKQKVSTINNLKKESRVIMTEEEKLKMLEKLQNKN